MLVYFIETGLWGKKRNDALNTVQTFVRWGTCRLLTPSSNMISEPSKSLSRKFSAAHNLKWFLSNAASTRVALEEQTLSSCCGSCKTSWRSARSCALQSCRHKGDTDLSRFLVSKLRSIPSMRFSKQRCMACCFSGGWLFTILFLRSEKYWKTKWVEWGRERHVQLAIEGLSAERKCHLHSYSLDPKPLFLLLFGCTRGGPLLNRVYLWHQMFFS